MHACAPPFSRCFTPRAIFHFLPCCLTAVGCLQVPGRTPEPKALRIVSFWHVCACMLHTVHVLLLTILALLDSLLVLQVCANQIAQPAHHSRVSAAEHGQGPLNCVAQHCCLTCCQPCLQRILQQCGRQPEPQQTLQAGQALLQSACGSTWDLNPAKAWSALCCITDGECRMSDM